jgi:hypothetical protein
VTARTALTERLALGLGGAAAAAALVRAGPPGNDLAAHVYQRDLLLEHGFSLWNNFWYAGRYSFVTYSLTYYPLAVLVGIGALAVVAVGASVFSFATVIEREWGALARWSSRAFGVVWPATVLSGAFPFVLGAALGLLALLALQARRPAFFALLTLLTLGASPLAFVLLGVLLSGLALSRSPRSKQIAVPALVVLGGLALELALRRLFPDRGRYPFSWQELLGACAFCGIGLVLTWRVEAARPLRFVFGVYLAACLAAFAVPSSLGENIVRLRFAAIPLAALALSLRRWRPRPVCLAAFALACSWNLTPLAFSFAHGSADPSASRAYWDPAIRFLRANLSPSYRAEVVDTTGHWGAVYLAGAGIPLARGWFRQDDFPQNAVLYGQVSASAYVRWLRSLGIRYVVVTDAPVDYSARREAAVVRSGRSGLKPVLRASHLTVYALPRPRPLVTGPGRPRVLELTLSGVRLRLAQRGRYRLAVRYSPYWHAASVCVTESADGMTRITAGRAGIVDLDLQFEASRAAQALIGRRPTCG